MWRLPTKSRPRRGTRLSRWSGTAAQHLPGHRRGEAADMSSKHPKPGAVPGTVIACNCSAPRWWRRRTRPKNQILQRLRSRSTRGFDDVRHLPVQRWACRPAIFSWMIFSTALKSSAMQMAEGELDVQRVRTLRSSSSCRRSATRRLRAGGRALDDRADRLEGSYPIACKRDGAIAGPARSALAASIEGVPQLGADLVLQPV